MTYNEVYQMRKKALKTPRQLARAAKNLVGYGIKAGRGTGVKGVDSQQAMNEAKKRVMQSAKQVDRQMNSFGGFNTLRQYNRMYPTGTPILTYDGYVIPRQAQKVYAVRPSKLPLHDVPEKSGFGLLGQQQFPAYRDPTGAIRLNNRSELRKALNTAKALGFRPDVDPDFPMLIGGLR